MGAAEFEQMGGGEIKCLVQFNRNTSQKYPKQYWAWTHKLLVLQYTLKCVMTSNDLIHLVHIKKSEDELAHFWGLIPVQKLFDL